MDIEKNTEETQEDVNKTIETSDPSAESVNSETQDTSQIQSADPTAATVQETEEVTEEIKKKSGVAKRIDRLVKERETLRRERDELLRQIETTTKHPAGKPIVQDFESYDQYVDALTDWKIEQKEKEKIQQKIAIDRKEHHQRLLEEFKENSTHFKEKNKDFDEVAFAKKVPYTKEMAELVLTSKKGHEIAYYFGKNIDEATRMAALPLHLLAREIANLEIKFSTPISPKNISQTPVPILPLGGSNEVLDKELSDEMSTEEWMKVRNKKQNKILRIV